MTSSQDSPWLLLALEAANQVGTLTALLLRSILTVAIMIWSEITFHRFSSTTAPTFLILSILSSTNLTKDSQLVCPLTVLSNFYCSYNQ